MSRKNRFLDDSCERLPRLFIGHWQSKSFGLPLFGIKFTKHDPLAGADVDIVVLLMAEIQLTSLGW